MYNTSVLNPSQWGLIFTLLSMDIMVPLYEAMGLQLKEKEKFISLLRRLIIDNRKIYEANPSIIPPLADRVMEMLKCSFSEAEAKNLYHWAVSVFTQVHAEQPQWSAWEMLFHTWAYNTQQQAKLLELPLERRNQIFSDYRDALNLKAVKQQIAELKSHQLSIWDMEIYSIHQFNNDDEIADPFNTVTQTIEINFFQLFWKKTISQLSLSDKNCFWEHGQQLLTEREVWMPEPLKHPDDLRRLLPC